MSQSLSAIVTTLNNAATLDKCLASLRFADELLVVDSGSSDATLAICAEHGARVLHHPFAGYGPQKAYAASQARHRLVLLLDADEWLPAETAAEIQRLLRDLPEDGGAIAGWRLPRREQIFWQYQAPGTRLNRYLRLFDRQRFRMSANPVHAAPEVDGPVGEIQGCFVHDGEPDIHTKVTKINAYSSGLVADKLARGSRWAKLRCIVYPPFFFVRQYLFKRQFVNGWAGFVQSVVGAFYVFLKYAKLDEARRRRTDA